MKNLIYKISLFLFIGIFPIYGEMDIEMAIKKTAHKMNLSLSDIKIEKSDLEFYGYGRFRTKLFDYLIDNPVAIDPFIRTLAHTILNNSDSLWALSYFPWARIDEGVRRGLIVRADEYLINSMPRDEALDTALTNLLLDFYQSDKITIENIPERIRIGLYLILTGIKNSIEWIENGTRNLTKDDIEGITKKLLETDVLSNPYIESLIEKTDFKAISAGAIDLAYVLPTALDLMKNSNSIKVTRINTKYGLIVIGGIDDDIYQHQPYLLIIDFGGNDTYEGGGVSAKEYPVSIIMDYYGNDRYASEIGCGTGIGGLGYVLDCEGNDLYQAKEFGLGAGIFGQGIIFDLDGDDEYTTDFCGIGAGVFGTGAVSDITGNDRYTGFQACQGFGYVKGCGLLIDKNGNDIYTARDDTIKYPSAQTEEHNTSLAQGAGFGIRADFTDGHSLAGGIGMIIDGQGNDKYSCGVFGQGCGYWFGTGILVDYQGDDEYNGVWYVQGSGAHFALGILIDSLGDDRYRATNNMALGAGHDFTLGTLFDYSGNDVYDVPNLSLGAGNANGMGLFIDLKGNDEYLTHGGITLGNASGAGRGSLRDFMKTIGIFIDGEGKDRYSEKYADNKKTWRQSPPLQPPLKYEWCIGIDF